MARRKTTTRRRKPTIRRRRVTRRKKGLSGMDYPVMLMVGSIFGGVGAGLLDKVIPASIDPKIASGAKVAAGLALGAVKMPIAQGIGAGMAANGASKLLEDLGVLNGPAPDIDDFTYVLPLESMSGSDDLPVLNGSDDLPVLNGAEDYLDVLSDELDEMDILDV